MFLGKKSTFRHGTDRLILSVKSKGKAMKKHGFQKRTESSHPLHPTSYGRVILRYTLFQIPSLVILILTLVIIRTWFNLPGWLTGLCITVWVLKDIVLFPFVWRAYDPETRGHSKRMIGKQARVVERLAPRGYVELHGELWRAIIGQGKSPVEKHASVRVLDVKGLTLLVESETESDSAMEFHSNRRGD
jgi:membrane protein implicated in regulation of membrane protease activity